MIEKFLQFIDKFSGHFFKFQFIDKTFLSV
jgi:hypothetical protein